MVMAATVGHPGFESCSYLVSLSPFSPSKLSSNETSIMIAVLFCMYVQALIRTYVLYILYTGG